MKYVIDSAMNVRIFVEGDADVKFIKDVVWYFYGKQLNNNDLNSTGGWDKIKSQKNEGELIRNKLIENADGKNLIIFDADNDYKTRKIEIEKWRDVYKLDFELFLFPNDKDNGELEDLLEKIIKPENKPIFDCWVEYEKCLGTFSAKRTQPLTIPAKKSKIYSYVETLVGSSNSEKEKIKDRNRDFSNEEHWALNSNDLCPIKMFLDRYLKGI